MANYERSRTVQLDEVILYLNTQSRETSTRKIVNILNVRKFTVFKILNEQLLHPFYIQREQVLLDRDFLPHLVIEIAENTSHKLFWWTLV